jgi:hypothetical protein
MNAAINFTRVRFVAELLGESETALRHLLLSCLLLAAAAAVAWLGACVDDTWLPQGHAGSQRVFHAFLALAALSFASVVGALVALGMWAERRTMGG